jgi:hypothetical protein
MRPVRSCASDFGINNVCAFGMDGFRIHVRHRSNICLNQLNLAAKAEILLLVYGNRAIIVRVTTKSQ